MHDHKVYFAKNTYISHSSCVKYDYLNHPCIVTMNIIYVKKNKGIVNFKF